MAFTPDRVEVPPRESTERNGDDDCFRHNGRGQPE